MKTKTMKNNTIIALRAAVAASAEANHLGENQMAAFYKELNWASDVAERFATAEDPREILDEERRKAEDILQYVYQNCYSDTEWFDLAYKLFCSRDQFLTALAEEEIVNW